MRSDLLKKHIESLEKQLFWLSHSYDNCLKIGLKDEYSVEEYDAFEILCSRFARSIDFLVRKVFRSIDDAEFEVQGSLLDVVNNAHKRGLFEDVESVKMIKEIRNDIAHEYIQEKLADLFKDVICYAPVLIKIIITTIQYVKEKHC